MDGVRHGVTLEDRDGVANTLTALDNHTGSLTSGVKRED